MAPLKSTCDVELLAWAAQSPYKLGYQNRYDANISENFTLFNNIAKKGYQNLESIAPIKSGGTGQGSLAAICFKPDDKKSPIVISYRGTKTADDVASDVTLAVSGVVQKKFRDQAYEFYKKIQIDNPGREIVLTGHSLGGHLAQYVGTKAYSEDSTLRENPVLQVRTFNTAPIRTRHAQVFQQQPGISNNIVNYRTSPDVVSDLPLQNYYGNTYVFKSEKNPLTAHKMIAVIDGLPDDVKKQAVGTSEKSSAHNALTETINGFLTSYQCRINKQFFSKHRAGAKNLREMENGFKTVLDLIEKNDYPGALEELKTLKDTMDGKVSKKIISTLIENTENIINPKTPKITTQSDFKRETLKNREKYTAPAPTEDTKTSKHEFK